jgi:hypothetical protein
MRESHPYLSCHVHLHHLYFVLPGDGNWQQKKSMETVSQPYACTDGVTEEQISRCVGALQEKKE